MGYTTYFNGEIAVSPPLNEEEIYYLGKFNTYTDYAAEAEEAIYGWCQWVSTADGSAIVWDEGEKFYDSVYWMQFIIDHFLKPDGHAKGKPGFEAFTFDHVCNGVIYAEGEDSDDRWALRVKDNDVEQFDAAPITYPGLDS
jgi:hypothetical protein